jgi:peptide deformylase
LDSFPNLDVASTRRKQCDGQAKQIGPDNAVARPGNLADSSRSGHHIRCRQSDTAVSPDPIAANPVRKDIVPIRPIVQYPDPRLHIVAEPISQFDDQLRILADDLLDTMRAVPGIGITAPHIGVAQRLVVLELSAADGVRVYVNPTVLWTAPETIRHLEASVSMPGVGDDVERPARIRIRYQDLSGLEHIEEAEGLAAICLQHEIDQLDGIFWIQRLSKLKRDRLVKRYTKVHRSFA